MVFLENVIASSDIRTIRSLKTENEAFQRKAVFILIFHSPHGLTEMILLILRVAQHERLNPYKVGLSKQHEQVRAT